MVDTQQNSVSRPPSSSPPHKKKSAVRILTSITLVVAIFSLAGGIMAWTIFERPGPLPQDKPLIIHGSTFQVANLLKQEGIIENPLLFTAITYLTGSRGTLKAGEYLFTKYMSSSDVLKLLQSGKVLLHTLTIPEGLTTTQIIERLNQNSLLEGPVDHEPGEGTLLPQTYKFPRGEFRQDLLKRMQEHQEEVLDKIWSHRASGLLLQTKEELITLASIVEKETGVPAERPRVATVMMNRLRIGMRLQSDPTVIYGLFLAHGGSLIQDLTKTDLMTPTPYNTYLTAGLPPGPICNPGRAALEAVAHPEETKDLYFVASPSGVGHIFSTNLEEHNANVMRWRRMRKSSSTPLGPQSLGPSIDLMLSPYP